MKDPKEKPTNNLLCPSYIAKSGAQLYGIINSSGSIDYLKTTIEINETFVTQANKGRAAEKRFRFAGNCAKSGCKQWSGSECGLIDNIIDVIGNEASQELQHCAIRQKCRWYSQKRGLACAQCNEFIRDIESSLIYE